MGDAVVSLRSLFKRDPRKYIVRAGIMTDDRSGTHFSRGVDWPTEFDSLKIAMWWAQEHTASGRRPEFDRWVVRVFPNGRERLECVVWSLS